MPDAASPPASPPASLLAIVLVALATGFAVMVVELAAVRAFAPSFGDSVPVWTNVIGVILLALALGAVAGGWLADRGAGARLLAALLAAAGGAVFLVPRLSGVAARWILPADLPLHRALPVLVEGSLGVALLVLAPPVLLLGAVAPMLIAAGSRRRNAQVGRVSGLVYAFGTIGSLGGTFLATHWLVPELGIRATFLVAGASLVAAGLCALTLAPPLGPKQGVYLGLAFVPALSLALPEADPLWLGSDARLLARVDSRYQRLWVVERRAAEGGRRLRELKINEGLDSFHSVWVEGSAWTKGRYYDAFALLPLLRPEAAAAPRVLSLGCAAGSILRVLRATAGPGTRAVGVDLDPAAIELGKRFFGLRERPGLTLVGDVDARVFVERVARELRFDICCLDAYRNQLYLPVQLASLEFFRAVRGRLAEGGVFAVNVGDLGPEGPVLSAVAGTLASVFPAVEALQVGGARNFLVVAHEGEAGGLAARLRARSKPAEMPAWLWSLATRDGAWLAFDALPPEARLSDDRSRLGLLHERVYGVGGGGR